MPTQRLQKIIAAAGIASRRKAEQLIAGGLVSLNGQIVTEPGTKADPEHDHIRVNGKLLRGAQKYVYLLMNKPKGYITAVTDPEKRPTVMDLLRGVGVRVYPVGRLDYASVLRIDTADSRAPIGLVSGSQKMLFQRNLLHHAFLDRFLTRGPLPTRLPPGLYPISGAMVYRPML